MGDILGDTLSMIRGQIGDKSGTNPYFTDILTMGGHTQMGSTSVSVAKMKKIVVAKRKSNVKIEIGFKIETEKGGKRWHTKQTG